MAMYEFKQTRQMTCERCGEIVTMRSPSQRFCVECGRIHHNEQSALRRKNAAVAKQITKEELEKKRAELEHREFCTGCAHDGTMNGARCCEYILHQIDYELPRRPHPVPMSQECLYYAKRSWQAGRLPAAEAERLLRTPGRPMINTLTGAVYANAEEASEKTGVKKAKLYYIASKKRTSTLDVGEFRFLTNEELQLLEFRGTKKKAASMNPVVKA